MNWKVTGKRPSKRDANATAGGELTIVGGPDTEEELRELVKGSHPDFQIEKVTPLAPELKAPPATAAAQANRAERAASK
jgi:hypothetical protein